MNTEPNNEEVKALIEFELAQIQIRKNDAGWSPWLLYASLGGLGWSVINEVKAPHNWSQITLIVCILTVAFFALKRIHQAITAGSEESKSRSRFAPTDWSLASSRSHLIVRETKLLIAAFLIHPYLQANTTFGHSTIWFAIFSVYASMVLLGIIITFTRLPLPDSLGSKKTWTLLETTTCCFIVFKTYQIAEAQYPSLAPEDIKFAMLIFGMAELVTMALDYRAESPTKGSLIQIRRSIGLGEISESDALERVKIALYGLKFGQFLEPQINRFFTTLTAVESKIKEKSSFLELIIHELNRPSSEIDINNLKKLDSQAKKHKDEVDAALKVAQKRAQTIAIWTQILTSLDKGVKDEVDQFQQQVNDQIKILSETEAHINKQQETIRVLAAKKDQLRLEQAPNARPHNI
jgi:hypothetical protein